MKYCCLFFVSLLLFSCNKEIAFDPRKPKNGQIVELFVDHYYSAGSQRAFVLASKETGSLRGFSERELGYTYQVRTRVNVPKEPPQDGPSYWFDFIEVIRKEKYEGKESFIVPLIASIVPGEPFIALSEEQGAFRYGNIPLQTANDKTARQLMEIWQYSVEMRQKGQTVPLKWRSIEAIVHHDPSRYGTGYLVERIVFIK